MAGELLTAAELAKRLGMRRNTILLMGQKGRIPRLVISRQCVRFDWEAVLAVFKENAAAHTMQPTGRPES